MELSQVGQNLRRVAAKVRHGLGARMRGRGRQASLAFVSLQQSHVALRQTLPVCWDERGYLTLYPDVAAEVLAGALASGWAHWLSRGYGERRRLPGLHTTPNPDAHLPRQWLEKHWDERGYLGRNPQAQVLVALGVYEDGLEHFWAVSRYQTPLLVVPASWDERGYLSIHADVAQAVADHALPSGYHHWTHWGVAEGRMVRRAESGAKSAATRSSPTHAERVVLRLVQHYQQRQTRAAPDIVTSPLN